MTELLNDPIIQSAVIPLALSFVLSAFLRMAIHRQAASAAIPLGLLGAYLVISGVPLLPPRTSDQKIPCLVAAAMLLAAALDLGRAGTRVRGAVLALGAAGALAWLGWPLLRAPEASTLLTLAALWIGGSAALLNLHAASRSGIDAPGLVLWTSLAAAPIALAGASASLAQYCGALAAALGGFLLWNWPRSRDRFGVVGVFGAGGALLALLAVMALYTDTSRLALLILLPALFADRLANRVPALQNASVLRPVAILLLCAVPAAFAIALARRAADVVP